MRSCVHAERAEMWRAMLLEPVEVLRATYVHHRFAPHSHEEYAIGVIERGAARTRLGGRDVHLPAGTVIVLPPGTVHDGRAVGSAGWSYRMLYAPSPLLRYAAQRLGLGRDPSTLSPLWRTEPALAEQVGRLFHLLDGGAISAGARERAFLRVMEACFDRLSRRPPSATVDCQDGAAVEAVRRVREYLDEARGVSVSLAELGRLAGLSPYHLNRTFRARVGLPPYKYYELVRVRRARRLIAQGQPLSQVTYAAGFADQSHLTRHFKRVVGLTPGQYARSLDEALVAPRRVA